MIIHNMLVTDNNEWCLAQVRYPTPLNLNVSSYTPDTTQHGFSRKSSLLNSTRQPHDVAFYSQDSTKSPLKGK